MTQKQLKELERLNERWANATTSEQEHNCALRAMDLLPEVLAHIKELERGIEGMHQSVQSMEMVRKGIEAERDAALKAAAELLSWATVLAEDAVACAPTAPGRLAVTLHDWFERDHQPDKPWGSGSDYVPKSELDAANAKIAEMRDAIREWIDAGLIVGAESMLSATGKGYRNDREWEKVVEFVSKIQALCNEPKDPDKIADIWELSKQALAHAEKLTGGAQ